MHAAAAWERSRGATAEAGCWTQRTPRRMRTAVAAVVSQEGVFVTIIGDAIARDQNGGEAAGVPPRPPIGTTLAFDRWRPSKEALTAVPSRRHDTIPGVEYRTSWPTTLSSATEAAQPLRYHAVRRSATL